MLTTKLKFKHIKILFVFESNLKEEVCYAHSLVLTEGTEQSEPAAS